MWFFLLIFVWFLDFLPAAATELKGKDNKVQTFFNGEKRALLRNYSICVHGSKAYHVFHTRWNM